MITTNIYEKEKVYKFFKLISEENVNGLIKKEYQEYEIKAYVDYQNYNTNISKIENIDTRDVLVGIIRKPTLALKNNITKEIIISDGDHIIFNDKKYELIEVKTVKDELKEYYTFYLTDLVEDIEFDKCKTELNMFFYKIFNSLGIEAIIYHSFFQNSYFEKIRRPFLTYEIKQIGQSNDFNTIGSYNSINTINHNFRTNRRYEMLINLYDRGEVLNLDVILSKNKIMNYIIRDVNYEFENITDLEIQKLEYVSENDTIINNKIMNQKIYKLEFTADTFVDKEIDYIEKIKIRR